MFSSFLFHFNAMILVLLKVSGDLVKVYHVRLSLYPRAGPPLTFFMGPLHQIVNSVTWVGSICG